MSCQLSFEKGYGGFVSLIPKTKLIDYYQEKYGFVKAGTRLVIFEQSAQLIIEKYLQDEKV